MSEHDPRSRDLTRRMFGVLGLGAAGAALAACQADVQDDGDGATGEQGANNPDGVFHTAWPYSTPPTGHFNFAPGVTGVISLGPGSWDQTLLAPGGMWDWSAQEWLYLLADSFEFTETQFVYNLKSGLTWSDGTDLTATDVEMTFWIRWLMNQQEWPFITGLATSGDTQVTFDLNDPSTVVERRIMKAPILPAAIYGTFAERARDLFEAGKTTDSDAAAALSQELQAWRPEDFATEVLASGPFVWDFDSLSDASITLVKNDAGVLADQVQFSSIVVYNGETDDITPLVLDGTLDYATHGFPVSTQQQWESNGVLTNASGVYAGMALLLSMGRHEEFRDPLVRQAFACAINKEEAAIVSLDEYASVSPTMAALPGLLADQWLDEETVSQLDAYAFDQDRATELLESAGWTLTDGTWMKPDGEPASYQITYQADYADYPPSAQYIAEQLTQFGIAVELDGIESANITDRMYAGQYDIMTFSWGGQETHPHFSYSSAFINENEPIARNQGGRGFDYELVREIEGMGEVDIQAMVTQCGEGLDEDRQRELIQQLALIFNAELPKIPMWERFGNNPCQEGARVLAFPAADDPIWASGSYSDNPVTQTMYRGDLRPS